MKRQNLTQQQEEAQRAIELVRSDMNLEKWQVFAVRQQKKGGWREIVRRENGKEMKLIIGKTPEGYEAGILTPADGKVFYGLLKLWEDAGKPDSPVNFTISQLIDKLELPHNAKTYKLMRTHLLKLRLVPLTFIDSYRTAKHQETITIAFNILGLLELFERRQWRPGERYFAFSEFKIDDHILAALKNRYVKPVRFDVIKQLKSEIAFVLYRYLDRVMFTETHYELDLRTVAEMCGMSETAKTFTIKARIKKALKELEGKEFTHGRITRAEIVPSASGTGWKCVFEKGKQVVIEGQELVEVPAEKVVKFFKYKGAASDVKVAGSFNGWQALEMGRVQDTWSLPVELSPGKYFYKFIVDGVWVCDLENPHRERDENGNENSVLVIE